MRPDFKRGNSSRSGGRKFGGGGRSGGNDRQMHDAVCSDCGRDCQVPFKPTSGKPILCSACFDRSGGSDRRGNDRDRGSFRGGNDRPSFAKKDDSKLLMDINRKLDKILKVLGE